MSSPLNCTTIANTSNNLIVTLTKAVKAAKSMVAGNLTRKPAQLKKELEKQEDAELKAKIEAKIQATSEKVRADIKLLKTMDNYLICKHAIMKPDEKYWTNRIGDSKASNEECLEARVISKGKIQKLVQKFRSQHVDCDEWLEEYFEFREKKKDLMEATQEGKKKKMRRDRVREAREKRIKLRIEKRTGQPVQEFVKSSKEIRMDRATRSKKEMRPRKEVGPRKGVSPSKVDSNGLGNDDKLHPSWASKRREKELLKKAFSGIAKPTSEPVKNRVVLNAE